MIHSAEILRIMTSIRHESSSSCKLEMHRNLDVAGLHTWMPFRNEDTGERQKNRMGIGEFGTVS